MMNNMIVPKKIILMRNAMGPVSCKIQDHKSYEVSEKSRLNMNYGEFINQPVVSDDGNNNSEDVFCDIGNAGGEARNHIHVPNCVFALNNTVQF